MSTTPEERARAVCKVLSDNPQVPTFVAIAAAIRQAENEKLEVLAQAVDFAVEGLNKPGDDALDRFFNAGVSAGCEFASTLLRASKHKEETP